MYISKTKCRSPRAEAVVKLVVATLVAVLIARVSEQRVLAVSTGPYPIILIHGFCDDSSTWGTFISTALVASTRFGTSNSVSHLYFDGTQVRWTGALTDPFPTNDPTRMLYTIDFYNSTPPPLLDPFSHYAVALVPIESKAVELEEVIDAAKKMSGKDKVILVGFSMGGLVARQYVESASYLADVERIITLDTPNLGSPLAKFSILYPNCAELSSIDKDELQPTSSFLHTLNTTDLPQWLPGGITSISSWVEESLDMADGDGVVSYASQDIQSVYPNDSRATNMENVTAPRDILGSLCLNMADVLACQVHTYMPARSDAILSLELAIQQTDRISSTHAWTTVSSVSRGASITVSADELTPLGLTSLFVLKPGSTTNWTLVSETSLVNVGGTESWTLPIGCDDPVGTWQAVVRDPRTWIKGDFNGDGIVNSIDFSIMNAHWFQSDLFTDINGDGIVNSVDYSILNSNWFKKGPITAVTFSVTAGSACH